MDIGIGAMIGTVYRWVFDWIKNALHLSDASAAWFFLGIALVISFFWNLWTGGFAGMNFDPSDISGSLAALAAAWATIVATAEMWFAVTKDRKTGSKPK